ncbi:hypothetical protein H0H92_013479, partial [Tricholoma furcatifolium]
YQHPPNVAGVSPARSETPPSPSPAPPPVPTPTPTTMPEEQETDNEESDDSSSSRLIHTPSTCTGHVRINKKNAVFDMVVGAMRGSKCLDIPHMKALHAPIDSVAESTQRFNRIIKEIIIRCERISEETGCWLLLLAQVPTSKGLTHYSSPRLRREAKADTITLINQYQTLIRSLAAKCDEALIIQKRYEAELEQQHAEVAQKDAELAQYWL